MLWIRFHRVLFNVSVQKNVGIKSNTHQLQSSLCKRVDRTLITQNKPTTTRDMKTKPEDMIFCNSEKSAKKSRIGANAKSGRDDEMGSET